MDEFIKTNIQQEQFNSLILQLLLDVKSRQIALQMFIASQMGDGDAAETAKAVNRIEQVASEWRVDALKEIYGQFGEMYPDILDLLNPKQD